MHLSILPDISVCTFSILGLVVNETVCKLICIILVTTSAPT